MDFSHIHCYLFAFQFQGLFIQPQQSCNFKGFRDLKKKKNHNVLLLHPLSLSPRLMQVGEEFCGSKSEVLQESIKRQSVNYFKHYHR